MPSYRARCLDCVEVFEYFSTIVNRNHPSGCSCGGLAERDVEAELASIGDRKKWVTDNERWSLSMGVPPASLAEYRERYPNSTYRDDGRLLIKNRKHKLQEAKARGFVELDNNRR